MSPPKRDPAEPKSPEPKSPDPIAAPLNPYPLYSPRFWHGMTWSVWWRLLADGGYRISPSRLPMAAGITIAAVFNSALAAVERIIFRRRIADASLHGPPVFIIGHWRSGTTLLHELLVRDDRFASPTTYQCFAPGHFLISEWFFRRFATWLLPGRRPMDNMAAGWDRPQEDEFALLNLGQPSPYRRIAYPRRGAVDLDYLDFAGVPPRQVEDWIGTLRGFIHRVSIATTRPLIIKSPTHTGRLAVLAAAFPRAKFIHLARDPAALYPSTCRLWRSLDADQALQTPKSTDEIESYVLECLPRMDDAYTAARDELAPNRLLEIRYEDLVADPVATLQRIYDELRLADFETVRQSLEDWAATEHRQYQPNTHPLNQREDDRIHEAWSNYFANHGYK